METLIKEAFAISEHIRYIAVYDRGQLVMKQRSGISNDSAGESDKYEELIVNPALIKITSQRGNIDCGGLHYLIIRYGNFFVLLFPSKNGHVNIGIEPDQNPVALVEPIHALLAKHHLN